VLWPISALLVIFELIATLTHALFLSLEVQAWTLGIIQH